jgi:transglutaminase-like putative cysteine protease
MRKLLLAPIFLIAFFALASSSVEAAVLNKNITRTFDVQDSYVRVTERIDASITDNRFYVPAGSEEVFVVFNPIVNDTTAEDKINKTLPTIQVKDAAGRSIAHTTEVSEQNILIKTSYPGQIRVHTSQSLIVTYDSYALTDHTGAIRDLYIPSYAEDYQFETDTIKLTIGTKVLIPKDFGNFNFITPEVEPKETETKWELNFTQEQLTGVITWIQIGTIQYYQFDISQPYEATSNIPLFFNTYSIILPRDITAGPLTQTVHYTEISPRPYQTRLDAEGNFVADFKVPATESGTIKAEGYIVVEDSKDFDIMESGAVSDVPEAIRTSFTAPAAFWETDAPEIVAKAAELKGTKTSVYDILETTYKYVVDQIDYSEVKRFGINERQGALKTLQGGAAVCMEYSDLFIALMRAQGVPARAGFGYGYDSRSTSGIDTAHQWAEVYLPTQDTWILVDTTWGETGTNVIGGDLNHFYKYVAGTSPLDPAPVAAKYFGSLASVPNEEFIISALAEEPLERGQSQSELLAAFPSQEENFLSQAASSIALVTSTLDRQVSTLIETSFYPQSGVVLTFLKLAIYLSPAAAIAGIYIFIKQIRKRGRKTAAQNS